VPELQPVATSARREEIVAIRIEVALMRDSVLYRVTTAWAADGARRGWEPRIYYLLESLGLVVTDDSGSRAHGRRMYRPGHRAVP
jgi:hypothetical protein